MLSFISKSLFINISSKKIVILLIINGIIMLVSLLNLLNPKNKVGSVDEEICLDLKKLGSDMLFTAAFMLSTHITITIALMTLNNKVFFLDFGLDSIIGFAGIMLPCIFILSLISMIGQAANILITVDNSNIGSKDVSTRNSEESKDNRGSGIPVVDPSPRGGSSDHYEQKNNGGSWI